MRLESTIHRAVVTPTQADTLWAIPLRRVGRPLPDCYGRSLQSDPGGLRTSADLDAGSARVLFAEIKRNEQRKREQAEKGYDSLRYFLLRTIQEAGVGNPEAVSGKIAKAFIDHPNWTGSDAELREVRNEMT